MADSLYEFPMRMVHKIVSRRSRNCFASLAMTSLRGAERRSNRVMHHDFREFIPATRLPQGFNGIWILFFDELYLGRVLRCAAPRRNQHERVVDFERIGGDEPLGITCTDRYAASARNCYQRIDEVVMLRL